MSYSNNPNLPQVRRRAVLLVKRGWSHRKVGRYLGYDHATIGRWVKRASEEYLNGTQLIPTRSSKPKSHPRQLKPELVAAIVNERLKCGRCAEVVYDNLIEQGIKVSLSSVKRTLSRNELLKPKSKWKRIRPSVPRPSSDCPGALVQMDTVHFVDWGSNQRFYVYVVLDVCSRWAYAEVHDKLRNNVALDVVLRAQAKAGFSFKTLQTDNGPEFALWFEDMLKGKGISLRHSRVRKPNDNAHIERFNRTLQDECLGKYPTRKNVTQVRLNTYLQHYNNNRKHMGINFQKPSQVVQSY